MRAYKYLFVHCTATVENIIVKPEDIERMHKGARNLSNFKVRFLGKDYNSRSELPDVKVGGVKAKESVGRGWSRLGYSKMFDQKGLVHTLTEHDEDNWIDSDEITWGASGFNSHSKHWVYSGGLSTETYIVNQKERHYFANTMTQDQERSFLREIHAEIEKHPQIKVIGHNQTAVKGCPCFDTRLWLEVHGVPKENIDTRPMRVNTITPFRNKKQGNDFRKWVNEKHPEVANRIDLDEIGSYKNAYILRAWYLLRHQYNEFKIDSILYHF